MDDHHDDAPNKQKQKQHHQQNNNKNKRKLRILVITMGGEREQHIRDMFRSSSMSSLLLQNDFEEPVFSPGIPSRSLRNRMQFFRICHQVGLIPEQEWQAMKKAHNAAANATQEEDDPKKFFDCLKDIPIESSLSEPNGSCRRRRIGNEADRKLHYSVELWRKAKTINRGRSVLACTLAHLLALQTFTARRSNNGNNNDDDDDDNSDEDDDDDNDSDNNENNNTAFDVLLEDNVRVPVHQAFCADRIRQVLRASRDYARQSGTPCHLRYYGWLGSLPNLRWIHESYLPKQRAFSCCDDKTNHGTEHSTFSTGKATVAPFPTAQDIEIDLLEKQQAREIERTTALMQTQSLEEKGETTHDDNQQQTNGEQQQQQQQQQQQEEDRPPGGTPVWGAYAYWISRQAYEHVLHELQQDVGSLLWKGKRARYYSVKPIDKILPRKVKEHFGTDAIHISTRPCFFRAPMLTSRIHAQWDASFCESTQYQLAHYCCGLKWSDLWLTRSERAIVDHYQEHGKWLTLSELEEMQQATAAAATNNSHAAGTASTNDINNEKQTDN